ncbi:lantibiotic dehydratase [Streptomyces sp. ST2-7A]|uniref:lantibiotic dehydratase n=1 Tax=Streptomyces sp. ST2-7A TaxID=2907214 RepID=UPI001F33900E|nr:lantibiotic dehydratase [Streptomyces sp. ST2-7A]MCE7081363.1 lantibiotic dehydratase [Streptomyces sp. ST2-7A]
MPRRLFSAQPVAMARIPLRPHRGSSPFADGLLTEGVFLANRAIDRSEAETDVRTRATLRAYDIRSRSRTTPHGVFAGVAAASLTARTTTLRLGPTHRAITNPGPRWLTALADRLLHEEPELLPVLTLTTSNLITRRGGRLETERPTERGAEIGSVRDTEVSRRLLRTCAAGTRAADILVALADRYPGTSPSSIRRAVLNMIEAGVLLSDLLPDDPRADPIHHLLERLPAYSPAARTLEQLRACLFEADSRPPGSPRRHPLLSSAHRLADSLHSSPRPLTVDTLADAEIGLPPTVGDSAELAASVLWRIGHRRPPLGDYHRRFCARYGHHRLVPVLEALDPATGLGPPTAHDALGIDEELAPDRATALAALLANALGTNTLEISLREHDLDQLANPSPLPPPRTAEIHIQLLGGNNGTPRIAVVPGTGSQDAGAAPGRWTPWLPELAPNEPFDDGNGTMVAEIVCRTRTAATGTLNVETGTAPWRIPLGVPTRPGDLLPEELALTTTGTHLLLWSTRHDRPVTPVLHSRIAPRLLPPVARTLHLLGHAGTRPWHPWSWGRLSTFPFTPGVRYRNILLAPARWHIPVELATAAGNRGDFVLALESWSRSVRPALPDTVVVVENDRHLPLDPRDPDERELLRRSVHRGARILHHPLGSSDALEVLLGPHGERHQLELVIPLIRRDAPLRPPPSSRRAPRLPGTGRYLPGSSWLSVALPGPAELHDTTLTELTSLLNHLTAQADIDRWFWLRYTTPALGPHLRLRFHGNPAGLAALVQPQLATAVDRLHQRGLHGSLHLEPYDRETERYGGPQAITAAEDLFCADSKLTLLALSLTEDERLLLAAASSAEIAEFLAPNHARLTLNPGRLTPDQRRRRDGLRSTIHNDPPALIPPALTTVHAERRKALLTYRDALPSSLLAPCASDVIHMHSNRLLGTDPGHERLARTLAADLLHRP